MFQVRKINPVAIATFFLASLTVVYGTYFVCNTALFEHTSASHSHDSDHHSDSYNHDSHSHDHSKSEDEDCCDDFTNGVIYDAKILVKELQISFSHFLLYQVKHCSIQILHSYEQLTALLYEIDRPPPRQASILIMIQVFRI